VLSSSTRTSPSAAPPTLSSFLNRGVRSHRRCPSCRTADHCRRVPGTPLAPKILPFSDSPRPRCSSSSLAKLDLAVRSGLLLPSSPTDVFFCAVRWRLHPRNQRLKLRIHRALLHVLCATPVLASVSNSCMSPSIFAPVAVLSVSYVYDLLLKSAILTAK
jgi:hypothetical protein